MSKRTVLKDVCRDLGVSGLQLSYDSRITQPVISRYMNGKAEPWPNHAKRIADALGWKGDPMELFEEVGADE